LAIVGLLIGALPARAGSVSDGTLAITAPDQAGMGTGCLNYRITYTVGAPLSGYSWQLTINVTKAGAAGDSLFASGDGPGSGTVYAFLCGFTDGPGTYKVQASLTSTSDVDFSTGPSDQLSTTLGVCSGACPVPKLLTSLVAVLQKGSPDIVRAHLTYGTHNTYGTTPISGIVTLWMHYAGTTKWTLVGTATTDRLGWAYIATRPKYWTAYHWTFSGNARFYGTTSPTVVT
jgi:hypothetical protein